MSLHNLLSSRSCTIVVDCFWVLANDTLGCSSRFYWCCAFIVSKLWRLGLCRWSGLSLDLGLTQLGTETKTATNWSRDQDQVSRPNILTNERYICVLHSAWQLPCFYFAFILYYVIFYVDALFGFHIGDATTAAWYSRYNDSVVAYILHLLCCITMTNCFSLFTTGAGNICKVIHLINNLRSGNVHVRFRYAALVIKEGETDTWFYILYSNPELIWWRTKMWCRTKAG